MLYSKRKHIHGTGQNATLANFKAADTAPITRNCRLQPCWSHVKICYC